MEVKTKNIFLDEDNITKTWEKFIEKDDNFVNYYVYGWDAGSTWTVIS